MSHTPLYPLTFDVIDVTSVKDAYILKTADNVVKVISYEVCQHRKTDKAILFT